MKKKILLSVLGLLLSSGTFAGAYAATCSVKVTHPDGTVVESKAEGETCTLDVNAGTCSCT